MEKEQTQTNLDMTGEEADLINSAKLNITKDGRIEIDLHNFRETLSRIKSKNEKIILQSGGDLGINIMMESSTMPIQELQTLAHKSLKHLRDEIPTQRMIGVS